MGHLRNGVLQEQWGPLAVAGITSRFRVRIESADSPSRLVEVLQVPQEAVPFFGVRDVVLAEDLGHGEPLFAALHVSLARIDGPRHDRRYMNGPDVELFASRTGDARTSQSLAGPGSRPVDDSLR